MNLQSVPSAMKQSLHSIAEGSVESDSGSRRRSKTPTRSRGHKSSSQHKTPKKSSRAKSPRQTPKKKSDASDSEEPLTSDMSLPLLDEPKANASSTGMEGEHTRSLDDTAGTETLTDASSGDMESSRNEGVEDIQDPSLLSPQPSSSGPEDSSSKSLDNSADMLFDYDIDYNNEADPTETAVGDFTEDDEEELMAWRMDPEESLSDWTIRMINTDDGKVEVFHIHKNMLAVGKRKSEYFVNEFKNAGRHPDACSVTEVSMATTAIKAMPKLLDFMYSNKTLQLSTDNAVGLRYLAQFFGIKVVFMKAMDFIKKDLSLATLTKYYRGSTNLHDEKMLEILAHYCGQNIMNIDNLKLLQVMDPYFFADIVSAPAVDTDEKKRHASLLVAAFCRYNKDKLDSQTLLMLTSEKCIPLIHRHAVLPLLDIEANLVVLPSIETFTSMTSLQQRCVRDLSAHWEELSEMDQQQIVKVCRKLPSFVVTELLMRSLACAKASSDASSDKKGERKEKSSSGHDKKKHTEEIEKVRRDYEAKLEQLKGHHKEELSELKKRYEATLTRMRDHCMEKDEQIEGFRQELERFERLPNSHDGKLVSSGRLNGHPTVMPEVGTHEKEGYMLAMKRKEGQKYPVFYYKYD